METRLLGAGSIVVALSRKDRGRGEPVVRRFRRRGLAGRRDPGLRAVTVAAMEPCQPPSPSPQPTSRSSAGGQTTLLAPPGPFDASAAELLIRDARALILTGCRSFIVDL